MIKVNLGWNKKNSLSAHMMVVWKSSAIGTPY